APDEGRRVARRRRRPLPGRHDLACERQRDARARRRVRRRVPRPHVEAQRVREHHGDPQRDRRADCGPMIRGVTGQTRVAVEHGWEVAATPAGAIADPSGLHGLHWIPARVPGTAAGALRDAGLWSWDTPRAFDAEDWWWRAPLGGELT